MASEIRDTTGDTETGADIAAIGTRRHRTARDFLTDVVEVETRKMVEAAVCKGAVVKTPTPPHQDRQKTQGGGQTGRKGGRLE